MYSKLGLDTKEFVEYVGKYEAKEFGGKNDNIRHRHNFL
jgi:hypothetical protein